MKLTQMLLLLELLLLLLHLFLPLFLQWFKHLQQQKQQLQQQQHLCSISFPIILLPKVGGKQGAIAQKTYFGAILSPKTDFFPHFWRIPNHLSLFNRFLMILNRLFLDFSMTFGDPGTIFVQVFVLRASIAMQCQSEQNTAWAHVFSNWVQK